MIDQDKTVLKTGDVAECLGVHRVTVQRWIKDGRLEAHQLPGRGDHRIQLTDLIRFCRENDLPLPPGWDDQSKRVLVVDDEETVAEVTSTYLERVGFTVATALDGFQAGRLLESFRPELILLDLNMPGMSGEEVIRQIRTTPSQAHIKILVMTGKGREVWQPALDAGADHVLFKPFPMQTLVDSIGTLLGHAAEGSAK